MKYRGDMEIYFHPNFRGGNVQPLERGSLLITPEISLNVNLKLKFNDCTHNPSWSVTTLSCSPFSGILVNLSLI